MAATNKPKAAKPVEQAVPHRRSPMDNPVVLFVLSVLCALLAWLIVCMFLDPQNSKSIEVPVVNYSYQSSVYTSMGLDIVEKSEVGKVSVKVEGNSTIVGGMNEGDIMVYPNYSTVQGPGPATLGLAARIINSDYENLGITLTVESPATISVVFDTVSDKVVPVTADTSQISIAEGFVLNKSSCVPAEVTLRGPTSELDKIATVAAPVTAEGELSDTTTMSAQLELRDEDGNVLTPQYVTMDDEDASVTVTVYQVREVALGVDFINTPTGFDTTSLRYTLSQEKLRVVGPARIVGALNELSVTSFDLGQEFAFDRDYQRQIELPNGIVSQDGVTTVTLSFDTTDMDDTYLTVSNIQCINVPSNLDIEVLTKQISGVHLFGPAEDIALLMADNVVAQLDCQNVSVTAGQQSLPVRIQIPSNSRVFAVGSYTVQCEITNQ